MSDSYFNKENFRYGELTSSTLTFSGEFTFGANSRVVLTGGLSAASVFWVTATSFGTGVGSSIQGIVLTYTTIVIAGSMTGALYAQTAVTLQFPTVITPPGACTKPDGTCFSTSCSLSCAGTLLSLFLILRKADSFFISIFPAAPQVAAVSASTPPPTVTLSMTGKFKSE